MPTFDPVAMGLERLMQDSYTPASAETGEASREGTQVGWYKYLGDRKQQQYDMQGNPTRIFENPGLGEQTLDFGKKVAPLALMALTMGGMNGAGPFSGMFGGPEALGELGGYGFTSTEVAGAAPTLLGEAGLEAAAAGAGGAATVAGAGAGTIAGAGAGAAGLGTLGSLASLASIGSGIYGMYKANQLTDQAQTNADKAAPWTSGVVTPGSGQQVAGDALKNVISGDFSNDAGFKLAQLSAARTSAQQPGGYSASAAANAAIKYQNDRILALSAPAGVGYNPSASAATAGTQAANTLAGQSLGSIGFGLSGAGAVSPQLQALLLKYGLV